MKILKIDKIFSCYSIITKALLCVDTVTGLIPVEILSIAFDSVH